MKRSKDKFYMKQIFDCISDGEIIATGKIAKEIGLSEKSSDCLRSQLEIA